MSDIARVVNDPIEDALIAARLMIEKIKIAMVKIYDIFAKTEIQDGIRQLPEVVRSVLKTGVEMLVKAIEVIVKGIKTVHEKGYVVIALLREVPNMVDAVADLLDEAQAKSARLSARIAAFTAVFVDEKLKDVQLMLDLFANLLLAVAGTPNADYRPHEVFELTKNELGYDPMTGPPLPVKPEAKGLGSGEEAAKKAAEEDAAKKAAEEDTTKKAADKLPKKAADKAAADKVAADKAAADKAAADKAAADKAAADKAAAEVKG